MRWELCKLMIENDEDKQRHEKMKDDAMESDQAKVNCET